MLVRASGVPVDLTLCDINPSLLEEALKAFPTSCNVETRQLDVNALPVFESPFDIVICVSGLHHLVHLEQTPAAAARSLGPGGEFWAVGEQVGRNGSRLWPESYAVANTLFSAAPEHYRVNRVLVSCL
jgi:ubiquinone/menaquinone biosynthesis C-methylase UbiE